MKLQFKEQDFQVQAIKAIVDCFAGQALKTNCFTLMRSAERFRQAKHIPFAVVNFQCCSEKVYRFFFALRGWVLLKLQMGINFINFTIHSEMKTPLHTF